MKLCSLSKGNVQFTSGARRWEVEGTEGSVVMD